MSSPILPLVTKTPGLLKRDELALYLNVGKNEIPAILRRFELEPVAGRFPWRSVWRQLLGIEPHDETHEVLLRQPLQRIAWVAAELSRSPSTVRRRVAENRSDCPAPAIDLGDPRVCSRSKRWIPELVLAHRQGRPLAIFRVVEPVRAAADQAAQPAGGPAPTAHGAASIGAFAEILRLNANASLKQLQ